jgi:hypothetical protein
MCWTRPWHSKWIVDLEGRLYADEWIRNSALAGEITLPDLSPMTLVEDLRRPPRTQVLAPFLPVSV